MLANKAILIFKQEVRLNETEKRGVSRALKQTWLVTSQAEATTGQEASDALIVRPHEALGNNIIHRK